jgi:hypothetical protein
MQHEALERNCDDCSNDAINNHTGRVSGSRKRNKIGLDELATLHVTPKRLKTTGTPPTKHTNKLLIPATEFPFFSLTRETQDEIYHFALCGLHISFKHHNIKITTRYTENQ